MNFSEMSDDELRAFLAQPVQAFKERQAQGKEQVPVDNTHGMSGWELGAAGFAKAFRDPLYEGPREIVRSIWRGADKDLKAFNAEKAQRQEAESRLMSNWEAQAGNAAGKIAASLVAPARMASQVGLMAADSALSPTAGPVKSTTRLLGNRALQGAEGAASGVVPGMAMKGTGRLAGAATNRLTPEGQEAMRLDAAAKRLGMDRNLGSLDPSSGLNAFESTLPGYARTVEDQVKAFSKAADESHTLTSKSGRSTEDRVLGGEKLRRALVEAGENLQQEGRALWNDLDSYVVSQGLQPVKTQNSSALAETMVRRHTPIDKKGVQRLDKNPLLQRVSEYDEDAAKLLAQLGLQGGKSPQQLSFSDMHKLQAAVGKALGRAEKDAGAPGAPIKDRQARTELKNLYGSLMSDVDKWGTKNPQAMDMYRNAKDFWRERVVPGVMNNPVYSKASKGVYGSNPRGYSEPAQLYSDVSGRPRAVGELTPWMSPEGRDLVDTLTTMPDLARALSTNTPHPVPSGMGTLTTMAGLAVGSPLQLGKAMISHMPGFRGVMSSGPAKKLYFSRDVTHDTPLGKVGWALAQPQAQTTEDIIREAVQGIE